MDRIKFKVNGEEVSVGCEVPSNLMLVDYLRNTLELRGTKYMCKEAGCGACVVSAVKTSGERRSLSTRVWFRYFHAKDGTLQQ